jgi:molybdenum cofactor cytidylyltransferase
VALPDKNGGHTRAPEFFDGCKDAQFVVNQNVMFGGIALLDVIEFLFFVHVNEHLTGGCIGQPGAIDLKWLKNDVAVRENDRRTPLLDVLDYFQRVRKQTVGKRIVDEKMRNDQQVRGARMLSAVTLQRAEVIRVAQLGSELLKSSPILLRTLRADFIGEVPLQVCCNAVVVQERVVDVEQKDDAGRRIISLVHLVAQMPPLGSTNVQQHIKPNDLLAKWAREFVIFMHVARSPPYSSTLELSYPRRRIPLVSASSKRTDLVADLAGVGGVILAAGPSTRMGKPKQLLRFCGQTLLGRAASAALEAGCRPLVVVTGAHAAASREALRELEVLEAENEQWESGMSSSVRVGIEALVAANPQIAAVVLMLCDQPFVTLEVIAGLVRAYRETSCSIVASRYGGSFGVPALFGSAYFAELAALKGDAGAKQVIQKHLPKVHLLPFPQGEIDVDTPDDFARLQSMNQSNAPKR